jgi:hypothetical protein
VSIYVKKNNGLEIQTPISRECPHCGRYAQLIPVATPSFAELDRARPHNVGLAFRCSACNEPRFARAAVRAFEPERIELAATVVEIERAKERFPHQYLPGPVRPLFREALDCYTADCFNAFASMCRRTIQAAHRNEAAEQQPHLYDLFVDVMKLTDVNRGTRQTLEAVLFAPDAGEPDLNADQAAVLIEVIKDMLYQRYVRTAKLKAAMKMRRYFASGGDEEAIASMLDEDRRAESA